jgi:hypothetical protein
MSIVISVLKLLALQPLSATSLDPTPEMEESKKYTLMEYSIPSVEHSA